MAKRQSNDIRHWALLGAEQRLVELADEALAIYAAFPAAFPEPRQSVNPYAAGVRRSIQGAVIRHRLFSTEARKRIAAAQRKGMRRERQQIRC